jgi:hypothetical protein
MESVLGEDKAETAMALEVHKRRQQQEHMESGTAPPIGSSSYSQMKQIFEEERKLAEAKRRLVQEEQQRHEEAARVDVLKKVAQRQLAEETQRIEQQVVARYSLIMRREVEWRVRAKEAELLGPFCAAPGAALDEQHDEQAPAFDATSMNPVQSARAVGVRGLQRLARGHIGRARCDHLRLQRYYRLGLGLGGPDGTSAGTSGGGGDGAQQGQEAKGKAVASCGATILHTLPDGFAQGEEDAALMLQCCWRGKKAYAKMVHEFIFKRYKCAMVLQAKWRAQKVRQRFVLLIAEARLTRERDKPPAEKRIEAKNRYMNRPEEVARKEAEARAKREAEEEATRQEAETSKLVAETQARFEKEQAMREAKKEAADSHANVPPVTSPEDAEDEEEAEEEEEGGGEEEEEDEEEEEGVVVLTIEKYRGSVFGLELQQLSIQGELFALVVGIGTDDAGWASAAGVEVGDVLIKLAGKPVAPYRPSNPNDRLNGDASVVLKAMKNDWSPCSFPLKLEVDRGKRLALMKIKIIGAKDLKNADVGFGSGLALGKSDPFCEVKLVTTGKSSGVKAESNVGTTKVVKDNLSPSWDEEFECKLDMIKLLEDPSNINLILECWDDDGGFFGRDFLGELELDGATILNRCSGNGSGSFFEALQQKALFNKKKNKYVAGTLGVQLWLKSWV